MHSIPGRRQQVGVIGIRSEFTSNTPGLTGPGRASRIRETTRTCSVGKFSEQRPECHGNSLFGLSMGYV